MHVIAFAFGLVLWAILLALTNNVLVSTLLFLCFEGAVVFSPFSKENIKRA